jgi:putative transposase
VLCPHRPRPWRSTPPTWPARAARSPSNAAWLPSRRPTGRRPSHAHRGPPGTQDHGRHSPHPGHGAGTKTRSSRVSYLQLGAAAERIAGVLADCGIDVSGRTILRWVQKFGPALATEVQRHRRSVGTTWLVDETYVKILGKWHYLYRGVDLDGQVLDCWLSATRDLPSAEAFFRRTMTSTGCIPEHVVTDKATFYPSRSASGHPMPSTRRPASTTG